MEQLLEMGVRFDEPNEFGCTPMLYALEGFQEENANILLKRGANVNIVNEFGCTPLHFSCSYSNTSMVAELLKRGADINILDKSGCNPLWYSLANAEDNAALSTLLLSYNPKIQNICSKGYDFLSNPKWRQIQENGEISEPKYIYNDPQPLVSVALNNYKEETAKTLIVLGCSVDFDITAIADDNDSWGWLRDLANSPQPLANLCRVHLRNQLPSGIEFHKALESLELCKILSDFMKAKDEIVFEN